MALLEADRVRVPAMMAAMKGTKVVGFIGFIVCLGEAIAVGTTPTGR